MPKETSLSYRTLLETGKRQDTDPYDGPAPEVENGDPEPYADTDYLRDGKLATNLLYTYDYRLRNRQPFPIETITSRTTVL